MELLWPIGGLLDLDNLIQMLFRISAALTRALELIWEPVFGYSREKCERFLNVCDFTFKKFEVLGLDFLCNDFLCVVWGVRRAPINKTPINTIILINNCYLGSLNIIVISNY